MNIFLRELKANRKSLIIWCICMFLLILSGMGKYTAYSGSSHSIQVFNKIPYSIRALLGIGSFDVTSMSGYFAMLFLYIELAASMHAVLLGAGIISKEERDRTTEFLIAKPVSRNVVVTSKLLAAFVNIIILNIVSLASSLSMVAAYNNGKDISYEILMFIFSMFIIQLIFLSLGAAMAAFIKNPKLSSSYAAGIFLTAFIISRITDLTDKLNFLNVFSPFKYFSYKDMADGNGLSIVIFIFSLVLVAVFSVSTYLFYQRRDLKT